MDFGPQPFPHGEGEEPKTAAKWLRTFSTCSPKPGSYVTHELSLPSGHAFDMFAGGLKLQSGNRTKRGEAATTRTRHLPRFGSRTCQDYASDREEVDGENVG